MNLLSVVLIGTGGVLIYSAVKGYDPRDVVRAALSGQSVGNTPAKYVIPAATFSPTTDVVPGASGL